MPKRIYMNHLPGARAIHVELTEDEVIDILHDLDPADAEREAIVKLFAVLEEAEAEFRTSRRDGGQR